MRAFTNLRAETSRVSDASGQTALAHQHPLLGKETNAETIAAAGIIALAVLTA
jgi:hypothetical protein